MGLYARHVFCISDDSAFDVEKYYTVVENLQDVVCAGRVGGVFLSFGLWRELSGVCASRKGTGGILGCERLI